jgi:hypothetical protein
MGNVVSELQKLNDLKELDVLLLPHPELELVRTSLPLSEVARVLSPLQTLHGIFRATCTVEEEISATSGHRVLSSDTDLPPPSEWIRLAWVLPNTSSKDRWKEIKTEMETEVRGTLESLPFIS